MTAPAVFWPLSLGLGVLIVGLITYRQGIRASDRRALGLVTLGPVFVAASIAAFAGEHFSAGPALAQLVPKWMPGRLFLAYFVGVAHLAAALSFVAKRYVRASSLGLALMFALFVLLMDLPGAITHPANRMAWILSAREGTFSIGALALFATSISGRRPELAKMLATIGRVWVAGVLVLYGIQHFLFPQFSPGVPSPTPTATWVPFPAAAAYATGLLLIVFGLMTFVRRLAGAGVSGGGLVMLVLTIVLYAPQIFLAQGIPQQVIAINFIFDTLLFAGTLLVVARAIRVTIWPEFAIDSALNRRPSTLAT